MRKYRYIPSRSVQKYYLNKKLHEDSISLQSEKGIIKTLFVVVKDINKVLVHFWSSHYGNQYGGFEREIKNTTGPNRAPRDLSKRIHLAY